MLVNPSNKPCEDRFNCHQLKNLDGYYSAVFDGHGGWQVAELAMKKLHFYIDEELKKCRNKSDKEIMNCITEGYNHLEAEWKDIATASFHAGFPKAASVGACALVSIVHGNKVYVANAGDSKAVMLRQTKDGASFERVKVSTTFNANKKYEQERYKKEFPNETVVRCMGEGACYVKGCLMPTRCFGDLTLKDKEFNFHDYPVEHGY